jgi:molybdopterin-containing oxidoreductase family iron-sulfur binding subunit
VTEATLQRPDELKAARPSLVLSGVSTPNAGVVATLAASINSAAGNVGTTIKPAEPMGGYHGAVGAEHMAAIATAAEVGERSLLFVRGANPAYDTPKSVKFAGRWARCLQGVVLVLRTRPRRCATSSAERPFPGIVGRRRGEAGGDLAAAAGHGPHFRHARHRRRPAAGCAGRSGDGGAVPVEDVPGLPHQPGPRWSVRVLASVGVGHGEWLDRDAGGGSTSTPSAVPPAAIAGDGEYFLLVYPHAVLSTGPRANKPWLQELPDPVSKVLWQSWVEVHPATAKKRGVVAGDHLTVQTAAGSITAPAFVYLGIRQDTVAVALGQGHSAYGRYAQNIGVNALDALGATWNGAGALALTQARAKVSRSGERPDLVTTEGSARQHGQDRPGDDRRRPGGRSVRRGTPRLSRRCRPFRPPRPSVAGGRRRPG